MYDVVIIGGGPGGYVAAVRAAKNGLKTALIEKSSLGGVCLNKGCIPTKTLLRTAKLYSDIKRANEFGLNVGSVNINYSAVMDRKNRVIKTLTGGVNSLVKSNGVDLINGTAEVVSPYDIYVNEEKLKTKNIIIATGSEPFALKIPGHNSKDLITSDDILQMEELPKSLAIIGGGVIGIELAVLFNELGVEITVVELLERILPMMDDEVSGYMQKVLAKKGIKFYTGAKAKEIKSGRLFIQTAGGVQEIKANKILMAVGRRPCLNGIKAEELGLETRNNAIITNDRMQTNIENIFAIGDVNGKYMLAHVASAEGMVAVDNILGKSRRMNYKSIPQCLYAFPEVSSVGLTEKQAKEMGYKTLAGRYPVSANGKALAEGEPEGFAKTVIDSETKEILGIHIVAPHATELIGEGVLALDIECTASEIAYAIHPHPTVSEILMEAFHNTI